MGLTGLIVAGAQVCCCPGTVPAAAHPGAGILVVVVVVVGGLTRTSLTAFPFGLWYCSRWAPRSPRPGSPTPVGSGPDQARQELGWVCRGRRDGER